MRRHTLLSMQLSIRFLAVVLSSHSFGCAVGTGDPNPYAGVGDAPPPWLGDASDRGEGARGAGEVCARWRADRANLSEGAWSGTIASCDAGDTSGAARGNALRLVNLYRWLAGLPPVGLDDERSAAAQQCALMMHANEALSHHPPSSWKCYSSKAANAAGKSNLAPVAAVDAIDEYMIDPLNAPHLAHRRWILSNGLGPIGIGSTNAYSCMWVLDGTAAVASPFVAWPPPGGVPVQAWALSFESLDETGWSVQSDTVRLGDGIVTVTENGVDRPVETAELLPNYGSEHALRFHPRGWTPAAGHRYHVSVRGISVPINYDVDIIDCR